MKTVFNEVFLFLGVLAVFVNGQELGYEEGQHALFDSKPQSCELIIDRSKFDGTCCSLSTTASKGCELNVKNGWCKITGQYWSKTFNSTDDQIQCDKSEHDVPLGSGTATLSVCLLAGSVVASGLTALLF
eukprot:scaffold8150_cov118-Cylindrotheca_fusiformis.AAC.9